MFGARPRFETGRDLAMAEQAWRHREPREETSRSAFECVTSRCAYSARSRHVLRANFAGRTPSGVKMRELVVAPLPPTEPVQHRLPCALRDRHMAQKGGDTSAKGASGGDPSPAPLVASPLPVTIMPVARSPVGRSAMPVRWFAAQPIEPGVMPAAAARGSKPCRGPIPPSMAALFPDPSGVSSPARRSSARR